MQLKELEANTRFVTENMISHKTVTGLVRDLHDEDFVLCVSFADGRLHLLDANQKVAIVTITDEETGQQL